MEEYIVKDGKQLRYGYTSGSCAAAAAKAAALMLLTGEVCHQVRLETPRGLVLHLPVEDIRMEPGRVSCMIRKDAGDDADVTDGMPVYASVSFEPEGINDAGGAVAPMSEERIMLDEPLHPVNVADTGTLMTANPAAGGKNSQDLVEISGGEGIGRVTRPGLDQPPGEWAINSGPRRQIRQALGELLQAGNCHRKLYVKLWLPWGRQLAAKTFNPRLGIEGGLSILGTSGIVEPMSQEALLETIRLDIHMKALERPGAPLVMTPGNYGQDFIRQDLNLSLEGAVKCSNFIGDALEMVWKEPVRDLLLIGHIGKLVKLGAGQLNTHSKYGDCRMEELANCMTLAGCGKKDCQAILQCLTTEEALAFLQEKGLEGQVMDILMERIQATLQKHYEHCGYRGLCGVEVITFSRQYGLAGETRGARNLLDRYRAAKSIYTDDESGNQ